jgi:hypothetical protein
MIHVTIERKEEVAHLSLIFLVLLMLYLYIKEKENDAGTLYHYMAVLTGLSLLFCPLNFWSKHDAYN